MSRRVLVRFLSIRTQAEAQSKSQAEAQAEAQDGKPGRAPGVLAPAFALAALLLLCMAGAAHAHQASISHSRVQVSSDRLEVAYQLELAPVDVAEVLGLEPDIAPTGNALTRGTDVLFDFVLDHIVMMSHDDLCPIERQGMDPAADGGRFVELTWRMRCAEPVEQLVIEYDLFFELDPLHRGLLQVSYGDEPAVTELKPGRGRFVWNLGAPPPSDGLAFLASGIEHIVYGFDHIAFLLGLLLVVVMMRSAGEWQVRGLLPSLHRTAGIVTSFTVAHSLTLIAASLGWIALDSQLVEAVIAASIIYVALENMVRADPPYRHLVTFAFGLIHGLGFASMLQVLLPPDDIIVPLLLFNAGVELGQLAIVAVVLPLLVIIARAIGAHRYRSIVIPAGGAILAAAGAAWLIERLFGLTILGL